jgi:hypothetical protein
MTSQGQRNDNPDARKDSTPKSTDISRQMSKLLESRRWEPRQGPFRGFESPPGRF